MKLAAVAVGCAILFSVPSPALGVGASSTPSPDPSLSLQQRRLLDLQVRNLEAQTSSGAAFRAWLPAGTILLGSIVAASGALRYFYDQRLKARLRLEDKISEELRAIAEYPEGGNSTSVRVVRALQSLSQLMPLTSDTIRQTRRVTDIIQVGVRLDADFDDLQQAQFDCLCLAQWPDYRLWLSQNPQHRRFILYRYQEAFRTLARDYPDYFRQMRLDAGGYVVPFRIPEAHYRHFQALAEGYELQFVALKDGDERREAVRALGEALGNPALARAMLDGSQ
jgi:hypothetical protein